MQCTNIYHDIYKISKRKCICYTKFLGGEVGTKAWGLDDVFPPDSLWFGSDAGPRLNIKTVLSTYGDFHVKDKTAVRTSYL